MVITYVTTFLKLQLIFFSMYKKCTCTLDYAKATNCIERVVKRKLMTATKIVQSTKTGNSL